MYWLFLSNFIFAFNNVLWKVTSRDEQPLYLISRRAILTFLITLIAVMVTKIDVWKYCIQPQFYLVLIGCLLGAISLVLFVTSIKSGSLQLLGYYLFLSSTLNGLYNYVFRGLSFGSNIVVGSSILLLGYLLFLWNERKSVQLEPVRLRQHLLLICFTVLNVGQTIIQWEALRSFYYPPLFLMFCQELVVLIIATILYLFQSNKQQESRPLKSYAKFPIMAIVIFMAVFCNLNGLKETNSFIASLVSVLMPLFTIVFGVVLFKEKIVPIQVVSFVIIIIAEIILI